MDELMPNIYEAVIACLSVDIDEFDISSSDRVLVIAV
jgi:hypothetical protein